MRCLALAQAWQDGGGSVRFLCRTIPAKLRERVLDEGFGIDDLEAVEASLLDALETARIAKSRGVCALAVDGYLFRDEYLQELRDELGSMPTLLIDDWGQSGSLPVSLVLNQNPAPWPKLYEGSRAEVLAGTSWTLLRREFRRSARSGGARDELLVTFGGSDILGLAPPVARELLEIGSVIVVVGAASDSFAELEALAEVHDGLTVLTNVTDMPSVMKRAKIAVSAAGSTSWELCYFGIPTVSVPITNTEIPIANCLSEAGAAIRVLPTKEDSKTTTARRCAEVIRRLLADEPKLQKMSAAAAQLVDGEGAARVAEHLRALCDPRG